MTEFDKLKEFALDTEKVRDDIAKIDALIKKMSKEEKLASLKYFDKLIKELDAEMRKRQKGVI